MNNDTIIAVSTSFGYGGIGVVRLSGDKAFSIAEKIFHPRQNDSSIEPRRMIFGKIYHFERKEYFEEAMMVYFPASNSYTREDVVEISCHGSPVVLEETVRLGIKAGARQARPGEFTQRAFLNERIDMVQAEAVNDLIHASSFEQAKISYRQISGSLSEEIRGVRSRIIHILSQIEASLEFPEDNIHMSSKMIKKTILRSREKIESLIQSYDLGKALKSGIQIAITGSANVGKSTLFNALLKEERAIVTPYPGTTRDYLSESTIIDGNRFSFVDMAGVDTPRHPIEKEGIHRGKKIADESDGILLMLDSSRQEKKQDLDLINIYRSRPTIVVLNKMDLPFGIDPDRIRRAAPECPVLEISALKKIRLDDLKKKLVDKFVPKIHKNRELVLHLRQKILLEEISDCLDKALSLLEQGQSEEFAAEEIRRSLPFIQQMTGEIRSDEVINDIFSRFCIGK